MDYFLGCDQKPHGGNLASAWAIRSRAENSLLRSGRELPFHDFNYLVIYIVVKETLDVTVNGLVCDTRGISANVFYGVLIKNRTSLKNS